MFYKLRNLGSGQLMLTPEWQWHSGKLFAYIYTIDQVNLKINHVRFFKHEVLFIVFTGMLS